MRKKHIIITLLMTSLLAILVACGGKANDVESVSYQSIQEGVDNRITYYYKKDTDEVTKQEAYTQMSYDFLGVKDAEAAKAKLEQFTSMYEGIEGVTEKIEFGETSLTQTVTLDYTKANFADLSQIPGIESINLENSDYISLDKSIQLIEQQGFKEVKDGKFEEFKE
ncbi:DUF1307 domain-containing protein [Streptococcus sp. CSL10205-OR2]|uniref:DUF1307 domain-containing protein n=1 Tax=Streptococcus sp. CSL10205-OR2 TaxID=2980558 RepID=UPI0021DAEF15|nr:DUF1307 domain-containing protein [Streptococcus sp. CSL10205-OR2]MCU9533620.1 DUF1307 domain-containing protein [Streptococcus sp. CSL10205-OR2]